MSYESSGSALLIESHSIEFTCSECPPTSTCWHSCATILTSVAKGKKPLLVFTSHFLPSAPNSSNCTWKFFLCRLAVWDFYIQLCSYGLVCLAPLIQHDAFHFHPCWSMYPHLLPFMPLNPLYRHVTFIHSCVGGPLACFSLLPVMNNAAWMSVYK